MTAEQNIHPEDLLDRARRGSLRAADFRILQAHLTTCSACRFEMALAPALYTHITIKQSDDELIARAIASAAAAPWYVRRFGHRSRPFWKPAIAAASAGLLIAAAASAAVLVAQPVLKRESSTRSQLSAPAANAAREKSVRAAPSAAHNPTPALAKTRTMAISATTSAPPVIQNQRTGATPERTSLATSVPSASTLTDSGVTQLTTCAEHFRRANNARRSGTPETALRLYEQLRIHCPGSSEELSSRVLVGRIYLDRLRDPGRALTAFDTFLSGSSGGVLREEALIGKALALSRLGRTAEELESWQTLLAAYPDSIYAAKAQSRLNVLK